MMHKVTSLIIVLLAVSRGWARSETWRGRPQICKIDLAFVVDTSVSIPRNDFSKQIDFIQDIVGFLDVGPETTRVAAVSYSAQVKGEFMFSSTKSKDDIVADIKKIEHSQGDATRTYLALNYVHKEIYAPGNGERPDVVDVVVVLTDGGTNPGSYDRHTDISGKKQTQLEATAIKARPAYVFAIGVGNQVNVSELNGISSDPDSHYTILVDSFSKLNSDEIKDLLYKRACEVVQPPSTPPPKEEECEETVADIFFVLDQSSSIKTNDNFKKELNFVVNVIDYLEIGPTKTQVGALKFSDNAHMEFFLNAYNTREDLAKRVSKITWKGGDTYLNKALRMVRTEGLVAAHGSRASDGVPQIVVVITDGVATDQDGLNAELTSFQDKNYIVVAIGVGPEVNPSELERIAANGQMYMVENADGLLAIRKELLTRLCSQSNAQYHVEKKP